MSIARRRSGLPRSRPRGYSEQVPVEAAARAIFAESRDYGNDVPWDDMPPYGQALYRAMARAALAAADNAERGEKG